ncbi:MAG: type II toxin-antitoxin system RelE/ParE family toxin [Chloroflexi bacterium]|nr:type II toxin-antitoxin system RelE/ParE family toxin [Chloroflexota bacterium]
MRVAFRTRRLERCFNHEAEAAQAWGAVIGRRYILRVLVLQQAERFDDLFAVSALRVHPLTGSRAGTYSMTLQGRWRLIVTLEADMVTVEEVSNHYDD